ncbi:hypothetical protein PsYK624_137420 [Phanerochaete sordida]|uniref:Uncharacterized protein n=1 Tax=Phanerochaete sordida TaxID=48140 RepID=A0A9P3GM43_9APHY|nr:hypothetical protein PsYK624_137420 [Phanerochaete sordida]
MHGSCVTLRARPQPPIDSVRPHRSPADHGLGSPIETSAAATAQPTPPRWTMSNAILRFPANRISFVDTSDASCARTRPYRTSMHELHRLGNAGGPVSSLGCGHTAPRDVLVLP